MKKSIKSILVSATLFMILAAFVSGTPKAASMKGDEVFSYSLYARAGSASEFYYCGEDIIVFVANSTDEINTGTEIWRNHTLTVHYPDGIITSRSGSTMWQSFYIVNGIVGTSAEPC